MNKLAVVYAMAVIAIAGAVVAGASPWILVIAAEFAWFLFDELVTGPRRQRRAMMQGDTGP
jgi:hypothetical protein